VTTLVYFIFVPKYLNWGISYLFLHFNTDPAMNRFYAAEFSWYNITARSRGTRIPEMLIDMLVFYSVLFLRWATENERKKYALEKDNLLLQLETLKAQLHPHFLFNTLNSIYGMSLTGAKETPAFILRLSDMMRYVLYECKGNQVPLEKDIHFLSNYLEMEKKRYPQADIQFDIDGPFDGTVAPLLLIPFVENSFKHGAHRVVDSAFIRGEVRVSGGDEAGMGRGGAIKGRGVELIFHLRNSVLPVTPQQKTPYGGVGIENVRKRLALYYPGKFDLQINADDAIYSVDLKIQLT
jgi:sensor histidine kinase YesM